jgi:malic enzyme
MYSTSYWKNHFTIFPIVSIGTTAVSANALAAAIESAVAKALAESDSTDSLIWESLHDNNKTEITRII